MNINKSIIAIGFFLFATTAFSADNDFGKVCGYFEKLQTEVSNRQFSKTEKANFIRNLVTKELKLDSAARAAWEVVIYAVPEVRYELYKTSAEETTKKKWQCKAMESLIPTAGD